MRIELLEEFIVFSKFNNFSKAAAELRLAQPALSRHMQQLEHEVGMTLIDRGKSIKLTPAGIAFLNGAHKTIDSYKRMRQETREAGVASPAVKIHDYAAIGKFWGSLLRQIEIPVEMVRIGSQMSDIEAINKGIIDIGMLINPVITDDIRTVLKKDSIDVTFLHDSKNSICMSSSNPLAKKGTLSRHDFEGIPITIFTAKQYEAMSEMIRYMLGDDLELNFRHQPMENDADIYLVDLKESVHICGEEANMSHTLYRDDVVLVDKLSDAELVTPCWMIYKNNKGHSTVDELVMQIKAILDNHE